MIELLFAGMTLAAVFYATFVKNMRHAILSLWVAGLGVGAIYLILGAELLAIIQWIISTLVTIAFIFFSVIFGEFYTGIKSKSNPEKTAPNREETRGDILLTFLALVLGGTFAAVIWMSSKGVETSLPEEGKVLENSLEAVGRVLTQENLLSLEVLALLLFLTLVGGGVVARFDGKDRS